MWSERLYSNFEMATLSLTYEKESGLWPFTKNKELVKSFLLEFQLSGYGERGLSWIRIRSPRKPGTEPFRKEGARPWIGIIIKSLWFLITASIIH